MRPLSILLNLPGPTRSPGYTCGEVNAGWGGEVRAPETTHGGCVIGVQRQVRQWIVHSAARCRGLKGWGWGGRGISSYSSCCALFPSLPHTSLEEAPSHSPPGDATWTLYLSTGLWGGFQCRRADLSVKFNAHSWVGPSGTGQEQGVQRYP